MKPILPISICALVLAAGLSPADTIFSWEAGLEGWSSGNNPETIAISDIGVTDGTKALAITTPMTAMWYSTPASIYPDAATRQALFTGATEITLDVSYPDPGYTSWASEVTVEVIIQGDGVPWTTLGTRVVPVNAAPQTYAWPLTIGQAASLAAGTWAQVLLKFTYGNGGSSAANAVFYVDKLGTTVVEEPPVTSTHFWKGEVSASWSDLNWAGDAEGATPGGALPANGTAGVAFSVPGAENLSTVLGANQNVKSMVFAAGSGAVDIGGTHNLTLGEDGIAIESGGGPVSINTTGQVILGVDQLWENKTSSMLVMDSVVSGSGELSIGGSGATVLLAANAHTGGTKVQQGTLILGNVQALGAAAAYLTVEGGTLDLNGMSPTIGGLAGNLGGVITNMDSEGATLTLDDESGSTYNGAINDGGGPIALVKKGSGPLSLGGGGNFTGDILIEEGSVTANSALFGAPTASNFGNAQFPDRKITVESAASVLFNTNNVLGNQTGNPNTLPTFVLNGSTLDANRYNLIGGVTLNGGTLNQGSSDSGGYQGYQFRGLIKVIGNSPSYISSSNGKGNHLDGDTLFEVANVTGDAEPDLLVSTPLLNQSGDFGTAPGGLSKLGPGTLALIATYSYSGPTKVEEGTLALAAPSLSDLAAVELFPGAILHLDFAEVDVVGSFVINGAAQAEGTWGAIGSGADHETPRITGFGQLAVVPDAFEVWMDAYPSLTGGNATRDADPDKDGLSNLEEFALNSEPDDAAISGKVRARLQTIGVDQALVITLPVRTGAVLSGTAPAILAASGATYEISASNDLSNFNQVLYEVVPALTGNPELPPLDGGWIYRSFRLDGNVGGGNPRGPMGFIRAAIFDPGN